MRCDDLDVTVRRREMRDAPELASMLVLQRGSRLSITPVMPAEWQAVLKRLHAA